MTPGMSGERIFFWPTCDDERVGDGGLGEHALDVVREELERLATPAVGVHQDHGPARSAQLRVCHTWGRQKVEEECFS